ncbi:MAG: transcriptional repressor LexA [Actinomycetota bacterium]|nr:transcriptional repressor LexA [Actinomycetota bacterium]
MIANESPVLSIKRREILTFIEAKLRTTGYPPSVREIATACNLQSPSSVQFHLNWLQDQGFITRDPSKPRALKVNIPTHVPKHETSIEVPLLGYVAAGHGVLAQEVISDEKIVVPASLGEPSELFALSVKGDSMIGDGIFERDVVVARRQSTAVTGELVVAGVREESEATVKRIEFDRNQSQILLKPSNPAYTTMVFPANDVVVYGKVIFMQRFL